MKFFYFFVLSIVFLLCQSCVTFHSGNYQHGVVLTEGNYEYVKKVSSTEKMTYFLLWGGNKKTKLLDKMREDVYLNAELKENQDLTNFLVSTDQSFSPLFLLSIVTVHMTADVIEWKTNDKIKTRSEVIGKSEKDNIYGFVHRFDKILEFYKCEGKNLLQYENGFTVLSIGDIVYSEALEHHGYVFEISGINARVEFYFNTGGTSYEKLLPFSKLQKLECPDLDK